VTLVIGLTGPIGCGKSTIAAILGELGGTVIDADRLARDVTAHGEPALALIRERFGDVVFASDGTFDRQRMAGLAFSDPVAMADLERIIHPFVRELVNRKLADASAEGVPFVSLEAIKLVEGRLADRCDEVWLVDCSPATRRERLLGRGADPADADRRLAAQGDDLTNRLAAALDGRVPYRILLTEASVEETRERVEDALAEVLSRVA
jgi:dephospho-CoA kinase